MRWAPSAVRGAAEAQERDGHPAARAPARRRDEARGTSTLMPSILEAVRAYATLGEVNQAPKDVFGKHKEPVKFG